MNSTESPSRKLCLTCSGAMSAQGLVGGAVRRPGASATLHVSMIVPEQRRHKVRGCRSIPPPSSGPNIHQASKARAEGRLLVVVMARAGGMCARCGPMGSLTPTEGRVGTPSNVSSGRRVSRSTKGSREVQSSGRRECRSEAGAQSSERPVYPSGAHLPFRTWGRSRPKVGQHVPHCGHAALGFCRTRLKSGRAERRGAEPEPVVVSIESSRRWVQFGPICVPGWCNRAGLRDRCGALKVNFLRHREARQLAGSRHVSKMPVSCSRGAASVASKYSKRACGIALRRTGCRKDIGEVFNHISNIIHENMLGVLSGRRPPDVPRSGQHSEQVWPDSGRCRPKLVNVGPIWSKLGLCLAQCLRIWRPARGNFSKVLPGVMFDHFGGDFPISIRRPVRPTGSNPPSNLRALLRDTRLGATRGTLGWHMLRMFGGSRSGLVVCFLAAQSFGAGGTTFCPNPCSALWLYQRGTTSVPLYN